MPIYKGNEEFDVPGFVVYLGETRITPEPVVIPDPVMVDQYKFIPDKTTNIIDLGSRTMYSETEDIIIEFEAFGANTSYDRKLYAENGPDSPSYYSIGGGASSGTNLNKFKIYARTKNGVTLIAVESTTPVFDGLYHDCVFRDIGGVCTLEVDGVVESLGSYTRVAASEMNLQWSHIFGGKRNGTYENRTDAAIARLKLNDLEFRFNEGTGSAIKDTAGNDYTILGTVLESQWVKYATEEEGPVQYTISVASNGNGTLTVNGKSSVTVYEGTELVFVGVADSGYELDSITPAIPTTATADGTYTATFTAIAYTDYDGVDDYTDTTEVLDITERMTITASIDKSLAADTYETIFGEWYGGTDTAFLRYHNSGDYFDVAWGNATAYVTPTWDIEELHEYAVDKTGVYVDGNLVATMNTTLMSTSHSVYLGAMNESGGATHFGAVNIADYEVTTLSTPTGTIFYPETYGAAKDGVTDDASAIQAAIDAASANGEGTVVLSAGTYLTKSTLYQKSNVKVEGLGDSSIIKPEVNTTAFWVETNCNNSVLKDFKIASNYANDIYSFYGVVGWDGGTKLNMTYDGLTIDCPNMQRNAFYMKANAAGHNTNLTIKNCKILTAGRMGIEIFSSNVGEYVHHNVQILNNEIANTQQSHPNESIAMSIVGWQENTLVKGNKFGAGIPYTAFEYGGWADNLIFEDNEFAASTNRFIYNTSSAPGPNSAIFRRNFTSNGARAGITMLDTEGATFSNNNFDLDFLVMDEGANDIEFDSNTITFNNKDGNAWELNGCDRADIHDNTITVLDPNTDHVFRLLGDADDNDIYGNTITEYNASIYTNSSSGTGNTYTA